MKLIEDIEEYKTFLQSVDLLDSVVIPIRLDSRKHDRTNPVCLVGVYTCSEDNVVCLPFDHPEADNLPYNTNFNWGNWGIDGWQASEFVKTGKIESIETFYPTSIKQTQERCFDNENVNQSIPIYKWMEFFREYGRHLRSCRMSKEDKGHLHFLLDVAIPSLRFIESSGLYVDAPLLYKHFGESMKRFVSNNFVYSQYNVFTSTGRPSCRFGGINFAALNKKDGSRKAFISRFDGGKLVLVDFESYHLRLIAEAIDYQLPSIPVHEYFGQQYFNTNKLTPEQYEESKQRSFQLLYSDAESEIPFFQQVSKYKDKLWKDINQYGQIRSPIHQVEVILNRIYDPNRSKVFNYLIQLMETERNLMLARNLIDGNWIHKQSKIILYNYDSFLIDLHPDEGMDTITEMVNYLEQKKYPLRIKQGLNYHEMEAL